MELSAKVWILSNDIGETEIDMRAVIFDMGVWVWREIQRRRTP